MYVSVAKYRRTCFNCEGLIVVSFASVCNIWNAIIKNYVQGNILAIPANLQKKISLILGAIFLDIGSNFS